MERINENLFILRFPELFNANCVLIDSMRRIFIVDTYLGPDSMRPFVKYIDEHKGARKLFIVNTHSHFDHIWGNCAFPEANLISHQLCLEGMMKESSDVLNDYGKSHPEWIKGNIEIIYPGIIFTHKLVFYDEDINLELEYLPGHTEDSIILFMTPDRICIAGDAVEDPFPMIQKATQISNIDVYIENLKKLLCKEPSLVIPGHGNRIEPELINDNILYLARLREMVQRNLKSDIKSSSDNIPAAKCLQKDLSLSSFYLDAHENNISQTEDWLKMKGNDTMFSTEKNSQEA